MGEEGYLTTVTPCPRPAPTTPNHHYHHHHHHSRPSQVLSNTSTGDAANQTVTTVVLQVPIALTPGACSRSTRCWSVRRRHGWALTARVLLQHSCKAHGVRPSHPPNTSTLSHALPTSGALLRPEPLAAASFHP